MKISNPKKMSLALLKSIVKISVAGFVIGYFHRYDASEIWGVTNNFWEYHDVDNKLPLWLPFGWMLAFTFLYKIERDVFATIKQPSFKQKVIISSLLVVIYPAIGEAITINFGVWTYYWPYKIFGVPAFAFLCLLTLHSIINYSLYLFCKNKNIKDPVFN